MKCCNSASNVQGSRLIIVVVQFGAVKIYVATVEALRKNERQDETQFPTKIDGFLSFIPHWMLMYCFAGFFKSQLVYDQNWWFSEFHPPLNANVLFCKFFFNLTLCMTKFRVLMLCFSYFTDNSNSFGNITWGEMGHTGTTPRVLTLQSTFSSSTLGCPIFILFFKLHLVSKKIINEISKINIGNFFAVFWKLTL